MKNKLIKKCLNDFENSVITNPKSWSTYVYMRKTTIVKELKKSGIEIITNCGQFLSTESLTLNKELNSHQRESLEQVWVSLFIIFIIEFNVNLSEVPSLFDPFNDWKKWSLAFNSK
jgi:hypothetical protein